MKIRIIEDDRNDLCQIQSQLSLISRQLNIPMQIKAYSNQDDIPYNEPVDCLLYRGYSTQRFSFLHTFIN